MNYSDNIQSVSYIGEPKSNTAMFLSAKAGALLKYLERVENCLVFAENGLTVSDFLLEKHHFQFSDQPQVDYYFFSKKIEEQISLKNSNRTYTILENGSRVGENVVSGKNVTIEPFCIIEHDCIIGNNVVIKSGSKVKKAIISDNVIIGENTIIGADGYNLVNIDDKLYNMPTLGLVEIASHVVINNHCVISAGLAGITRIGAHTQIDSFCHIHHDCQIGKNVELCSAVKMGGFVTIGDQSFLGIGSQLKNRVKVGRNVTLGMGSVVINHIADNVLAYGNPAKEK